ncbi:hypothetical protein GC169_11715 [bacterium]|nr:hypothetical protein [bacterium]
MTDRAKRPKGLRGVHVLAMMGGFFSVVIATDIVFIFHAVSSFPGEVTPRSYVQGIEFNSELERKAKQDELGWTVGIGLSQSEDALVVDLKDAAGVPLNGQEVRAAVRSPGLPSADFELGLDPLGEGLYSGALGDVRGRLDVSVEIRSSGQDLMFEAHRRLRRQ